MNKNIRISIIAIIGIILIGGIVFLLDKANIINVINNPKVYPVDYNKLNIQPTSIDTNSGTELGKLSKLYTLYTFFPKNGGSITTNTTQINPIHQAGTGEVVNIGGTAGTGVVSGETIPMNTNNNPQTKNEVLVEINNLLSKDNKEEDIEKFNQLFDARSPNPPILIISNDQSRACAYRQDAMNPQFIDAGIVFISKDLKITTLGLDYDKEKIISVHGSCMLMQTAVANDDGTYTQNTYHIDVNTDKAVKAGSNIATDMSPLYMQVINEKSPKAIVMQGSNIGTGATLVVYNLSDSKNTIKTVSPIYNIIYKTDSDVIVYPSNDNTLHSYNITTGEDKGLGKEIPKLDIKTFTGKYYFIMNGTNIGIYDSNNKEVLTMSI